MNERVLLLTSCQVRMARAALKWSVDELARQSGVNSRTISRIESTNGIPNIEINTLVRIQSACESHGVVFLASDESNNGPGVCYAAYEAPRPRLL